MVNWQVGWRLHDLGWCGGQNTGSKDIHTLILRTYEDVTLHGKSNLAGVIKDTDTEIKDYSKLSQWAQFNHMSP